MIILRFDTAQKLVKFLESLPIRKSVKIQRFGSCWAVYKNPKTDPWKVSLSYIRGRCSAKGTKTKAYKHYSSRGIKCRITASELKKLWIRDNAESMSQPSVDRIDSSKDYTFENCRYMERRQNSSRKVTLVEQNVTSRIPSYIIENK